ncbi:MAG: DUF3667 domain-containing protein [Flavobacteriales bacterium]|nr:DUF3667 domain-containing protein [Flavobacteriales bacterium]
MANDTCPNCGTSLEEGMRFCPACGQEQRERVVPLGQLFQDVLRENFAFDSKFFRSVPLLFFRPGSLTKEFIAGRHVRYIPAVRLYVFVSVIAFLVFALFSSESRLIKDGRLVDQDGPGYTIEGMEDAVAEVDSLGVEEWKRAHLDEGDPMERFGQKLVLLNHQGLMPVVLDRFRQQLPLPLLLMLPLLALVLKLLFWKRFFVVHLVFSFHWAAFLLLTFMLLFLVDQLVRSSMSWMVIPIGLVQLVLALRNVHGIGWLRSSLSGLVVVSVTLVLLGLTMMATMIYVVDQV